MVLVDTSVWIETFRRRHSMRLDRAVEFDDIVICLPVFQEVLQGFREEGAFRLARQALAALPMVESPMTASLFEEAVSLYRIARQRGFTIRSSADCLIAACAIRHDLTVLHRDRDFPVLARVSALKERTA